MTWRCILLCMCLSEASPPQPGCRVSNVSSEDAQPTFGLSTRAYEAELPYLAPWLEHHLKLDMDELCIVVTRLGDTKPIREFVQPFNISGRITLWAQASPKWGHSRGTSCGKRTWYANLDQDEYLVLPGNFSRLRDFLAQKVGANEVRFEWLFVPYGGSDAVIPQNPRTFTLASTKPYAFEGIGVLHRFGRGKYFGRTSDLGTRGTTWRGARCPRDRKHACCQGPPGYLLHVTRGLADVVLKQRTAAAISEFSKNQGSRRVKYLAMLELCLSQEAFTVPLPAKAQTIRIAVDKDLESRLLTKSGLSMEEEDEACERYEGCRSMSGIKAWYATFKEALFANHRKVLCDLKTMCVGSSLHAGSSLPIKVSKELSKLEADGFRTWNRKCLSR